MIFQRISLWIFWLGGIIDAKNAKVKGIYWNSKFIEIQKMWRFHFAVVFRGKLTTLAAPILVEICRCPSLFGDVQDRLIPNSAESYYLNTDLETHGITPKFYSWLPSGNLEVEHGHVLFWKFHMVDLQRHQVRESQGGNHSPPLQRRTPLRGTALSVGPKPPDAEVGQLRREKWVINSYWLVSRFSS